MSIRVYNTLSKTKEPFEPVQPGKVGIYLCGPTVYKPSHIGHMVGPVLFDCFKRYLTYCGYDVTLVINITDVDDKLIAESHARNLPMAAVAEEMTADYMRNLEAMGVDTVDHFPKATEHIDNIIQFIQALVDKEFAYESDGDVYFDVNKDPEYGKLSHRSLEALQGEGGEAAQRKRSTADFALWKRAKPGEPCWESPWGAGRPGWHIECSAMSCSLLGETFDIHGGGLDLVFPHHENEIAQSECCHGRPQAKYWMHNGLMQASDQIGKVGGRTTRTAASEANSAEAPHPTAGDPMAEDQATQQAGKISKSRGASALSELLKTYQGEAIRFFLLGTHYRRPIDYSLQRIDEVQRGLEAFYRFFDRYERITGQSFYQIVAASRRADGELDATRGDTCKQVHEHRRRFLEAMDDDFNTGGAIGELFELVRTLNRFVEQEKLEATGKDKPGQLAALRQGATTLRELSLTLGLFRKPLAGSSRGDDELVGKLMQLFIEMRAAARKDKNFALADSIRNGLSELGITLEDRPDGTKWSAQK